MCAVTISQGNIVLTMDLSKITTYQAGATQANMHRKLQKICDTILQPYGVTKMQWLIIGYVLDAGRDGIRVSDLADKLGTTMSYLTNSVNLLESRAILERRDNASDTRSRMIVVCENYIPTCQEIERTLRDGLRKSIYAKIDPKEFVIYIKVMRELAGVDISNE